MKKDKKFAFELSTGKANSLIRLAQGSPWKSHIEHLTSLPGLELSLRPSRRLVLGERAGGRAGRSHPGGQPFAALVITNDSLCRPVAMLEDCPPPPWINMSYQNLELTALFPGGRRNEFVCFENSLQPGCLSLGCKEEFLGWILKDWASQFDRTDVRGGALQTCQFAIDMRDIVRQIPAAVESHVSVPVRTLVPSARATEREILDIVVTPSLAVDPSAPALLAIRAYTARTSCALRSRRLADAAVLRAVQAAGIPLLCLRECRTTRSTTLEGTGIPPAGIVCDSNEGDRFVERHLGILLQDTNRQQ